MLSHSILLGNNRSQLQFIDDLINLCKRHKIGCGKPKDLQHLCSDLVSNDGFRDDLFALCTAIGHMSEVELSSEQLLVLVARAFGGPKISVSDIAVDIPQDASSAFLDGYETWSGRDPDVDAVSLWHIDRNPVAVSPRPRPTLYYTASSRLGPDHSETFEDSPASASANGEPSRLSISPDTPLESLTISQLRMYLEEIENLVSRSGPHLEQTALRPYFYPEYFEEPEVSDLPSTHEAEAIVDVYEPEPVPELLPEPLLAPLSSTLTSEAESALVTALDTARQQGRRVLAFLRAAHDQGLRIFNVALSFFLATRQQRPRAVDAALAFLVTVVCVTLAIFAYHSLKPQPPTYAESMNRFPAHLGESKLESGVANSASTDLPSAPTHDPETIPGLAGTVQDTHLKQASTNPNATESESNTAPASASKPHNQIASQPRLTSVALSTSEPADTPISGSIAYPDQRPVAVPAATMMSYAVSAPSPAYPSTRRFGVDSTVAVETIISEQGQVINAKALTGTPAVRASALQAVQNWRFKPFLHKGKPVPVVTTFKFFFGGQ
jgi:TonB family protein